MENPKIDEKGILEIRKLRDQVYMFIKTNPGYYRGGYTYSVSKVAFLLTGSGIYMFRDALGFVVEEEINPHTILEIPAGVPHLFYFQEESYMMELFSDEYSKEPDIDFQKIKKAREN